MVAYIAGRISVQHLPVGRPRAAELLIKVWPMRVRGSKYGAKKVGKYASKREAVRAHDLALLQKIGEISELREQVKFELIPKQDGERAVTYTVDFAYKDASGQMVYEDSKGMRTQQYILRRKLMLWVHGIRIKEV